MWLRGIFYLFNDIPVDFDHVLNVIDNKISEEDNITLLAPFEDEEFCCVMFQVHPDKALGHDRMNPRFYRHFWNVCGNHIIDTCKSWLASSSIPHALNETNISIIPKCDKPRSMKDLRPISLCNAAYKVLSKVLANCLKPFFPSTISEERRAFVENRAIIDNILLANEIVHYLNCETRGHVSEVGL